MAQTFIDAEVIGPRPQGSGAAPVSASPKRPQPGDVAGWFALQNEDPKAAREWAMAMRKPVEHSLEDLRHRPRRAAELLAPVMDVAFAENRKNRLARAEENYWKWMSIIVSPSLWPLTVKALWEGEPVWDFMERRAGWYQVVEAVLVASSSHSLLGRVETPLRRRNESERPLHDLLRVPMADPDGRFTDDESTPSVDEAEGSRVMVLVGVYCQLAVRVCGHPPESLRPALQLLCQEADRMLERATSDAAGRAAMIERLLQRALMKNSPTTSPWTKQSAIVLGAIASLMLLATLTYYGKQERVWQDAVRVLSEEPGLQIVGETTSWGRREIRGLRDPLARDPKEVLDSLGINTKDVVLKFKAYLSAEQPFLLKHVTTGPRQVIAPAPASDSPPDSPSPRLPLDSPTAKP